MKLPRTPPALRATAAAGLLALLLSACERPQLHDSSPPVDERPAAPVDAAAEPPPAAPLPDEAAAPVPAPPAPPDDDAGEEGQPELRVEFRDGEIRVSGALRSSIQRDRIPAQLSEAFPGIPLVDELRVETNRHAVGWGNRVTEEFLIPYFQSIDEPSVSYLEGVIVLEGRGRGRRDFQQFQELAIEVFSGEWSEDIDNQIRFEP